MTQHIAYRVRNDKSEAVDQDRFFPGRAVYLACAHDHRQHSDPMWCCHSLAVTQGPVRYGLLSWPSCCKVSLLCKVLASFHTDTLHKVSKNANCTSFLGPCTSSGHPFIAQGSDKVDLRLPVLTCVKMVNATCTMAKQPVRSHSLLE